MKLDTCKMFARYWNRDFGKFFFKEQVDPPDVCANSMSFVYPQVNPGQLQFEQLTTVSFPVHPPKSFTLVIAHVLKAKSQQRKRTLRFWPGIL